MNESLVRTCMRGLQTRHESSLLASMLETDADACRIASEVPADAFLRKLRNHLNTENKTDHMNDDASPATQLESDEEVQRVQAELRNHAAADEKSDETDQPERPYRPTTRPPVAILVACDDGKNSGESHRIRGEQFVIGRSDGDLKLPHDEMVSSRHAAITRQTVGGQPKMVVTDLQSRNGLFVRVTKAPLTHKAEFLIGGGHYRLEIVQDVTPETTDMVMDLDGPVGTRGFDGGQEPGAVILSEVVAGRPQTKTKLEKERYLIGRNHNCDICRSKDLFTAGQHALLTRSEKGTWVIESQKTQNGLWLRMPQIVVNVGKSCEFRLGEQRFRMKFGSSR